MLATGIFDRRLYATVIEKADSLIQIAIGNEMIKLRVDVGPRMIRRNREADEVLTLDVPACLLLPSRGDGGRHGDMTTRLLLPARAMRARL